MSWATRADDAISSEASAILVVQINWRHLVGIRKLSILSRGNVEGARRDRLVECSSVPADVLIDVLLDPCAARQIPSLNRIGILITPIIECSATSGRDPIVR